MIKKCEWCAKEFTNGVDGFSYNFLGVERNFCCDCGKKIGDFLQEAISEGALFVQYGKEKFRIGGEKTDD